MELMDTSQFEDENPFELIRPDSPAPAEQRQAVAHEVVSQASHQSAMKSIASCRMDNAVVQNVVSDINGKVHDYQQPATKKSLFNQCPLRSSLHDTLARLGMSPMQ